MIVMNDDVEDYGGRGWLLSLQACCHRNCVVILSIGMLCPNQVERRPKRWRSNEEREWQVHHTPLMCSVEFASVGGNPLVDFLLCLMLFLFLLCLHFFFFSWTPSDTTNELLLMALTNDRTELQAKYCISTIRYEVTTKHIHSPKKTRRCLPRTTHSPYLHSWAHNFKNVRRYGTLTRITSLVKSPRLRWRQTRPSYRHCHKCPNDFFYCVKGRNECERVRYHHPNLVWRCRNTHTHTHTSTQARTLIDYSIVLGQSVGPNSRGPNCNIENWYHKKQKL
jgi:hypothetical protein